MRFAYCGYDFFWPCLQTLVDADHELVALYSFPTDNEYDFNTNVFRIAQAQKASISLSRMMIGDIEFLAAQNCELILSAAYPFKIPDFSRHIPFGINIHPTLLPEGRGPWPLPWIILKQLTTGGVTIHKISPKWDAGDILKQCTFPLDMAENLETLSMKTQMAARDNVLDVVDNLPALWQAATPQQGGNYWPMVTDADRTLDWNQPVADIDRVVRAFGKFDSNATIEGVLYWVQHASVWQTEHSHQLGQVVHRSNREIVVAAKDGFVCLRQFKKAPIQSTEKSS